MCVAGIENANEESIIHTEYAVKSNPNKNVDDLVIIDSFGEEECCRETVIAVLLSSISRCCSDLITNAV